jgi:hypothetical protein
VLAVRYRDNLLANRTDSRAQSAIELQTPLNFTFYLQAAFGEHRGGGGGGVPIEGRHF